MLQASECHGSPQKPRGEVLNHRTEDATASLCCQGRSDFTVMAAVAAHPKVALFKQWRVMDRCMNVNENAVT